MPNLAPNLTGTILKDSLFIGIVLASVDSIHLQPRTTAINTLMEVDMTWEDVMSRLIEKVKTLRGDPKSRQKSSSAVSEGCSLCGKKGHDISACFLNLINPDSRLGLSAENLGKVGNGRHSNGSNSEKDGKQRTSTGKKKKSKARSAQAKPENCKRYVIFMMLDNDTTSHMTPNSDKLHDKTECDVEISLAGKSTVITSTKGTHTVKLSTSDGWNTVALTEALFACDMV